MNKTLVAQVPLNRQGQGITRLGLMDDSDDSGGVFLLMFSNSQKECKYDQWYETVDQAENAAYNEWGVNKGDWKVATELRSAS